MVSSYSAKADIDFNITNNCTCCPGNFTVELLDASMTSIGVYSFGSSSTRICISTALTPAFIKFSDGTNTHLYDMSSPSNPIFGGSCLSFNRMFSHSFVAGGGAFPCTPFCDRLNLTIS